MRNGALCLRPVRRCVCRWQIDSPPALLAAYRAYGEQQLLSVQLRERGAGNGSHRQHGVERLAVLDMSIQATERRIAAVSLGRQPPVWHSST